MMNRLHPYRLASSTAKRLPAPIVEGLKSWLAKRRDQALAERIKSLVAVTDWQTPACAICDQNHFTHHLVCNGFKIVRCRNDGLMFVSPRPASLEAFYDERYYTGRMPGVYENYDQHAITQSLSDWDERLKYLEDMLGKPGRLLDVGCATGEFLKLARSRSWEVSGLEFSEWAVSKARSAHSLSVMQGGLPDSRIPNSTYDVVTLWDCIEHLPEPREVLLDVRRILKPGGKLMLSTGVLPHEDPGMISKWYYPPWHLYYFSENTIRRLLADCGFTVVSYVEQDQDIPEYMLMVVAACANNR
ncbi:MAG: methyltransferase domain-containing protein [Pyrinomonadaceae bacterium]